MSSDTQFDPVLDDAQAVTVAGKVMVSAIILLSVVVTIVVFLHLYARRNWRRNHLNLIAAPNEQLNLPGQRHGLDPVIIQSLPIIIYNADEFKDRLECSVCLSEVSEGEKARILPKCNHGFHTDCIDMWFQSHSTCPLCRNTVSSELLIPDSDSNPEIQIQVPDANQANGRLSEPQNFPTNVLFWGTEDQVRSVGSSLEEGSSSAAAASSSGKSDDTGTLTIEIPKSLNRFSEEESKSPMIARLKSLKRLLSMGKRTNVSSPNAGDIERGDSGCTQSTKMAAEL